MKQSLLTTADSPLLLIVGNPDFPPGLTDRSLARGYFQASHFVSNGRWLTLERLTDIQSPFQLTFWTVVQLHHFLHSLTAPGAFSRDLILFEECLHRGGRLPRPLSKVYGLLSLPSESS